jgi:hypothetical protein
VLADCPKRPKQMGRRPQYERANVVSDRSDSEIVFMSSECISVSGDDWYIDSGATQHMSRDRAVFSEYNPISGRAVYMGDHTEVQAVGEGTVRARLQVSGSTINGTFTKVLHVPDLKANLISVSRLIQDGFTVNFTVGGCQVLKSNKIVAEAVLVNRLYRLCASVVYYEQACFSASQQAELWHKRLGHVGEHVMKSLISSQAVVGLDLTSPNFHLGTCEGCMYGKHHRSPMPLISMHRSTRVLELVHTDVLGLTTRPTQNVNTLQGGPGH